jgi:hypothetical protein
MAPSNVRFRGAKQTWLKAGVMSAYDPKQSSGPHLDLRMTGCIPIWPPAEANYARDAFT